MQRDPLLDLPLTIVPPSPPIRGGAMSQPMPAPPPQATQQPQKAVPEAQVSTKKDGGFGVLDGVVHALLGTPDRELNQQQQGERSKRRKEAGKTSAALANDPGAAADSYMDAPGTGSSGFGLADIVSIVRGALGGSKKK